MVQRTISSSGINGGYDVTSSQNTINALKGTMISGARIYASDVNALISLWNSFNGHTHGISDLYGIKDFGNTNPSGYSTDGNFESDTTGGPGLNGDIATISQGGTIYASKINELVSAVSGGASHSHSWDDRTS